MISSEPTKHVLSKNDLRENLINKAQMDLANQKRSYKHLRAAMYDFKDGSMSNLGKINYATSSVPH